jgi:hypothetical protein
LRAGFNGGKLLNPGADRNVLDTDPLSGTFFQSLLQVFNKGEGTGFRCGFGIPKPDKDIGEILEAPTVPVLANLPGQTA